MTKQEFVEKVQEAAGVDQTKANTMAVVEAVFESIADVVKSEQSFRWFGFGTFESRQRPARKGYNPQTGKPMKIKASTTVAFRPASALKEHVGKKSKAKAKAQPKASSEKHPRSPAKPHQTSPNTKPPKRMKGKQPEEDPNKLIEELRKAS